MRLFWLASLMIGLIMAQWQEDNILSPRQEDSLGALESMGIQLLSSILSPEAASSTASSASATSSSTSGSATSSSSSVAVSSTAASSSSARSALSAAAETASPSPTALSASNSESSRHRNIAIIVGSVLGAVVVLLAIALLWFCCARRRRRRAGITPRGRTPEKVLDDDDELDGLNAPGNGPGMAYVTRIESWHEPRNSRNSSRGPPKGSQSRVSLVQRDLPPAERFNNGPAAPVPIPMPPPHRASSYGLIQNDGPYDEPRGAYFDRPHRHSMDDASRDANRYPGYVPYRSSTSLVERSPTPLFGSGKTPGETTHHTIKRKSVGSASQAPTAVNTAMNSKDPSPHSTGNGPWIPPKSKRRESLPGSPLQHEFEFGFDQSPNQPRRISRGERMPGGWSSTSVADAHQRF